MSTTTLQNTMRDVTSAVTAMSGGVQNVGEAERWFSLATGGLLALDGLRRGSLIETGLGAALLYRGTTGHCSMYQALGMNTAQENKATGVPAQQGFKFERTITINRAPEDLYDFWRNFENLPRVMKHLRSVTNQVGNLSHWVAVGPMGLQVAWEAEVTNEDRGRLIAWRSLPGGMVDTAGSVHFDRDDSGLGTRLTVALKYNPPGGKIGANIAWLMGSGVEQEIESDLQRFKQTMERSGETSSFSNQPVGAGRRF
jgi:uncharacterized membrane protein